MCLIIGAFPENEFAGIFVETDYNIASFVHVPKGVISLIIFQISVDSGKDTGFQRSGRHFSFRKIGSGVCFKGRIGFFNRVGRQFRIINFQFIYKAVIEHIERLSPVRPDGSVRSLPGPALSDKNIYPSLRRRKFMIWLFSAGQLTVHIYFHPVFRRICTCDLSPPVKRDCLGSNHFFIPAVCGDSKYQPAECIQSEKVTVEITFRRISLIIHDGTDIIRICAQSNPCFYTEITSNSRHIIIVYLDERSISIQEDGTATDTLYLFEKFAVKVTFDIIDTVFHKSENFFWQKGLAPLHFKLSAFDANVIEFPPACQSFF